MYVCMYVVVFVIVKYESTVRIINRMFGSSEPKKPTIAQQQRVLDREYRKLEDAEQKLEQEIKRAAAKGQNDICKVLAKQLIELRKQKTRMQSTKSKMTSINAHCKSMQTSATLAKTMGNTASVMTQMNKTMRPEAIAGTMRDFQKANMQMNMTDEMINDTFDEMFDSGDEEQSKAIMNQVLDEIGIEVSSKLPGAPTSSDVDIEQLLAEAGTSKKSTAKILK